MRPVKERFRRLRRPLFSMSGDSISEEDLLKPATLQLFEPAPYRE
jgi:hypothetical protein